MAPVVKMHTLGHDFIPAADPCRWIALSWYGAFHLCACMMPGYLKRWRCRNWQLLRLRLQFARTEGIVPAPRVAHAIRAAIDEALDAKAKGEKRVILFNLSGHGNFDMTAYQAYMSGQLEDYAYPEAAIKAALETLPKVNQFQPSEW